MKYFANGDFHTMESFLRDSLVKQGYEVSVQNVGQLTDEEFAKSRASSIGASDSSVLLDVSYESKSIERKKLDELFEEKLSNKWDTEISQKASVRKGKELEPFIIEKASKIIDGTVLKPRDTFMDYKTGLSINFDGVVFELNGEDFLAIPFEIKYVTTYGRSLYNFVNAVSEFDENPADKLANMEVKIPNIDHPKDIRLHVKSISNYLGIPAYYYSQIQQQIKFLDAPYGYLCVIDELEWTLYIFKIPRDQIVIDEITKRAKVFYAKLAFLKGLRFDDEISRQTNSENSEIDI